MKAKQETKKVTYQGKVYFNTNGLWTDEKFLVPPSSTIRVLNARLREKYPINIIETDPKKLLDLAELAIKSLDYELAEMLTRKAIELKPSYFAAHAKLCSVLRMQEKPDEALSETDKFRNEANCALLTSRAAAYADLGMWEKAKNEIAPVLLNGNEKSKEYAFMVVGTIKKYRPDLYESDSEDDE